MLVVIRARFAYVLFRRIIRRLNLKAVLVGVPPSALIYLI